MDINKLTIKTQEILSTAQQLAMNFGNQSIETGHILKAILNNDKDVTPYLLNDLNVNIQVLEMALDKIIESYPKVSGGQIYMSNNMNSVLNNVFNELKQFGDEYVSIEILLYALINSSDSVGTLLKDSGATKANLKNSILNYVTGNLSHQIVKKELINRLKNLQKT